MNSPNAMSVTVRSLSKNVLQELKRFCDLKLLKCGITANLVRLPRVGRQSYAVISAGSLRGLAKGRKTHAYTIFRVASTS
jgi:hypothetical protein